MGIRTMTGITFTAQYGIHHGLQATIDRHQGVLGRGVATDFGNVGPDRLWKLNIFKVDGARFGQGAVAVAEQWARTIQPLLRGKGLASESCPGCHIRRIGEINYEMSNKGILRR